MFFPTLKKRLIKFYKNILILSLIFTFFPFFMGAAPTTQPFEQGNGKAIVLTISAGIINSAVADYIEQGLQKAERERASLFILELDTPGGALQATRAIVKLFLNAKVPVVVFVSPSGARAGSAGVFITLAGHIAAMNYGTNIGAAHPVVSGGKDPEKVGKHIARKIENDTVAFIEAIAIQRHRNVKWAKNAVLKSISVTAREALKLKVIDLLANDLHELLDKLDGRTVQLKDKKITLSTKGLIIERVSMKLKQKIVDFLAHPNVLMYLLLFGGLGLWIEITHPGVVFPGVVGIICLFLSFLAMQIIPINYGGLAMILLGGGLFVAELMTPTFGALFVGGLISITVGALFLVDSPDPAMQITLGSLLPTMTFFSIIMGFILYSALRSQYKAPVSVQSTMIGRTAFVSQELNPQGKVKLNGELWNAISQNGQIIPAGSTVEITEVNGLKLVVKLPSSEKNA